MKAFVEFVGNKSGNRLVNQERLILAVTLRIRKVMEDKGINRASLAKALKVSKARVTKILSGDSNITLRTLSDIGFALNVPVVVDFDNHLEEKVKQYEFQLNFIGLQFSDSSGTLEIHERKKAALESIRRKIGGRSSNNDIYGSVPKLAVAAG